MNSLEKLRKQIDELDLQMLKILAERFRVVKYVAASKMTGSKHDPKREIRMLKSWLKQAKDTDLEPEFIEELLRLITSESKKFQSEIYNKK